MRRAGVLDAKSCGVHQKPPMLVVGVTSSLGAEREAGCMYETDSESQSAFRQQLLESSIYPPTFGCTSTCTRDGQGWSARYGFS